MLIWVGTPESKYQSVVFTVAESAVSNDQPSPFKPMWLVCLSPESLLLFLNLNFGAVCQVLLHFKHLKLAPFFSAMTTSVVITAPNED